MTLSKREVRYAESRAQGTPPVPSAKIAGLSTDNVDRYERDPRIRACLDAARRVAGFDREFTRDDVLQGFYEATQMAANAGELVSAWREIGKVIGAYEPQQVDIRVSDRRELQQLSDEELTKQLEGEVIEGDYELLEFDDPTTDVDVPVEPPDDE